LSEGDDTIFTGYEKTVEDILITKYRVVKSKGREICQMVFDKTPFYAESGGQTGIQDIFLQIMKKLRSLIR